MNDSIDMKEQGTQIKLEFCVFGDEPFQHEFTRLVSIEPTTSWDKGEFGTSVFGAKNVEVQRMPLRKEYGWEFSIGYIPSLQFEDVAVPFIETFEDKIAVIKKFITEKGLRAKLDIVIEIEGNNTPGLHLDNKIIAICHELGAEIGIDLYTSC